ncbi:cyclic lactone autoinducer peptide [Eubacterium sp.]
MKANLKKLISNANIKMLSSLATFALVITTVASNQRCWYVLHEEKLPENAKKLRKF